MARLPIFAHPHPVLRKVAAPVTELTPELVKLVEDMAETMYSDDGVGLAAPQVGASVRLIVCDPVPADEQGKDLLVLFNPEITAKDGEVEWEEGCLSVPEVNGWVTRAERVSVKGFDQDFKPVAFEAEGLKAVCLQHELDHLDGKLFFDRLGPIKRKLLLREYTRRRQQADGASQDES
jgi:peptide deformylase